MATIKGQWTLVQKDRSLQRSSQTLSAVFNEVYIFGGEVVPREPRDDTIYILDLKQCTASQRARLTHYGLAPHAPPEARTAGYVPPARVGTASSVVGDHIYIFSGRGGVNMAPVDEGGSLWQFYNSDDDGIGWLVVSPADPSQPVPEARSYHCMTSDKTSRLYLHAGCPASGRLSDLWSFNVNEKKWTQLASAPGVPRGGTSITYHAGKLYRMGGFDGKHEIGGELDIYDIASNTWSAHNFTPDGVNAPGARSVATLLALTIDGRPSLITAFGERDPSALGHAGAGNMLPDTWIYDIETKEWKKVVSEEGAEVPRPRGWFAADIVINRIVTTEFKEGLIVHGGLAEGNERLDDAWVLSF
jgi:hypothetical protein